MSNIFNSSSRSDEIPFVGLLEQMTSAISLPKQLGLSSALQYQKLLLFCAVAAYIYRL
jgi:hypothetical protein